MTLFNSVGNSQYNAVFSNRPVLGDETRYPRFSAENAQSEEKKDALQVIATRAKEQITAHNEEVRRKPVPNAREEFLEFMQKTPAERMRDQILASMGLSEEDLATMSPEERMAVEEKIAFIIREKMTLTAETEIQAEAMEAAVSEGQSINELSAHLLVSQEAMQKLEEKPQTAALVQKYHYLTGGTTSDAGVAQVMGEDRWGNNQRERYDTVA